MKYFFIIIPITLLCIALSKNSIDYYNSDIFVTKNIIVKPQFYTKLNNLQFNLFAQNAHNHQNDIILNDIVVKMYDMNDIRPMVLRTKSGTFEIYNRIIKFDSIIYLTHISFDIIAQSCKIELSSSKIIFNKPKLKIYE